MMVAVVPQQAVATPGIVRPPQISSAEEAKVQVKLELDASGRVARCVVTQPSGNADLDRQTCQKAKSVRLKDGKPQSVIWKLDAEH